MSHFFYISLYHNKKHKLCEELSCSKQNILFGIAINLFNKYEND